jgi:hypothetical protein
MAPARKGTWAPWAAATTQSTGRAVVGTENATPETWNAVPGSGTAAQRAAADRCGPCPEVACSRAHQALTLEPIEMAAVNGLAPAA